MTMIPDSALPEPQRADEAYFDKTVGGGRSFDGRLLRQRLTV